MVKLAVSGLGLTALACMTGWLAQGSTGAIAAGSGGLVATAVQVGAGRLMEGEGNAAFARFMARWGMGMGLRIVGVLTVVALVVIDPSVFAPLATALGFLGVLIPLLALEFFMVQ
jgi:hypothetical protein